MRLRVPVASSDGYCPLCDGIADRFGDHARACPCGGDRTKRHNRLRAVVAARAMAAGLSPEVEKQGLLASTAGGAWASESGRRATRHSDGRLMFTSLHGGPMGQQLLISPPRVACEAQCFPSPLLVVGLLPPITKGESEPSEHGAALPRPRPPVRASCG